MQGWRASSIIEIFSLVVVARHPGLEITEIKQEEHKFIWEYPH